MLEVDSTMDIQSSMAGYGSVRTKVTGGRLCCLRRLLMWEAMVGMGSPLPEL